MKVLLIILMLVMLIGCATKPDVIVINGNTYIFKEGVENFYYIDSDGNRQELTE